MKNQETIKLTQLSRSEMKKIAGGDACSDRANACFAQIHDNCDPSAYGAFATCIGTTIIGCSPLHEFELLCHTL